MSIVINHTFPIDLVPSEILLGTKSIWKAELRFGSNFVLHSEIDLSVAVKILIKAGNLTI